METSKKKEISITDYIKNEKRKINADRHNTKKNKLYFSQIFIRTEKETK